MKERVREWLDYAKMDLLSACKLSEDENLTSSTAFHSHQCCEKSFKALIEYTEKTVPKIHDLVKLYHDVKKYIDFASCLLERVSVLAGQ
ncbi:MAG TPA: HEPN domain-containing protein [Spirochaetota bacterium]|nr:HEPN domain-containing protein [Spirochaetota bacterium]HPR37050.1 HEPN domain-containing protein [Spirochaetota bacterium]